jgi:hypothetical protein
MQGKRRSAVEYELPWHSDELIHNRRCWAGSTLKRGWKSGPIFASPNQNTPFNIAKNIK